jgi:hypothetical protein
MTKLYPYAITARFSRSPTEVQIEAQPGAVKADNKHEAVGFALEVAKGDVFSDPKFFNHQASVVNIPASFLNDIDGF